MFITLAAAPGKVGGDRVMRHIIRKIPILVAIILIIGGLLISCSEQGPVEPSPVPPIEMFETVEPPPSPTETFTLPTLTPSPTNTPSPTLVPTAFPTALASPLVFDRRPIAVMIDNSPTARPHTGLAGADLVYEAVVEAGITRLMAVFGRGDTEWLGPVRSTRHYFVYWAFEYNAVLVHAGASPQGFAAIDRTKIDRLDFSSGRGVFQRRNRPYAAGWENLYTNLAKDRELIEAGTGRLGSLLFTPNGPPVEGSPANIILIKYPGGYSVEYRYDQPRRQYARFIAGIPQVDEETKEPYRATNIIIQWMDAWRIRGDDAGRMDMALEGKGPSRYFIGGNGFIGSWQKMDINKPTDFLADSGKPMILKDGPTWIQIVPTETIVEVR
jgi:hypothetical protein